MKYVVVTVFHSTPRIEVLPWRFSPSSKFHQMLHYYQSRPGSTAMGYWLWLFDTFSKAR